MTWSGRSGSDPGTVRPYDPGGSRTHGQGGICVSRVDCLECHLGFRIDNRAARLRPVLGKARGRVSCRNSGSESGRSSAGGIAGRLSGHGPGLGEDRASPPAGRRTNAGSCPTGHRQGLPGNDHRSARRTSGRTGARPASSTSSSGSSRPQTSRGGSAIVRASPAARAKMSIPPAPFGSIRRKGDWGVRSGGSHLRISEASDGPAGPLPTASARKRARRTRRDAVAGLRRLPRRIRARGAQEDDARSRHLRLERSVLPLYTDSPALRPGPRCQRRRQYDPDRLLPPLLAGGAPLSAAPPLRGHRHGTAGSRGILRR